MYFALIESIRQKNIIAKLVFLPIWDTGKRFMFYLYRKLEIFQCNISGRKSKLHFIMFEFITSTTI